MNIIEEKTTQEELEKDYKNYPNVAPEGLKEKPWYWNRLGPIFYETPYGSTVLDIGANAGEFVEILEKERGCKAFGIDISETCVKEAKEKGRKVQLANAHQIPFPDSHFDVVYLNEVLVHVFKPEYVLQEIRRVLKPNGFLLGSTPHKNMEAKLWDDERLHRRYYDENELTEEIKKVFPSVYIRVLNGGQFAQSMAESIIGDEPAEILFKCGGDSVKQWEEALLDKTVLRAWFGFTQQPADVYYRMRGYADKMREKGCEIAYEDFKYDDFEAPGSWQKKIRWKHVQHQFDSILDCADLSVWQIVGSLDAVAFLRCVKDAKKKPVITEIDDWLFDIPSYNAASSAYKPNSDAEWCAYEQIKLSDCVIVSTKYLKESLAEIFSDKPIYIVKNSIDFDVWEKAKLHLTIPEKKPGIIRIGYTGCGNHNGDVEITKKVLISLLDEHKNLEIVWPEQFESWKDVSHERIHYVNKWLPLTHYPGMVKGWDLDIGIAPLRDNNLNRSKSNLRWLEFSAIKLPTVCSKVIPFQDSIVNGQTGYLVNSNKEWYERLNYLILNKSERNRIGENAYKEVFSNYNMNKVADGYMELLKEIKNEFK